MSDMGNDKSDSQKGWVARKLEDPSFLLGFEQEWLSDQFCDLLQSALENERLSRADVARRLGRSRASITKSLQRGRNLTIRTMVELLDACGYRLRISARRREKPTALIISQLTPASVLRWKDESGRTPPVSNGEAEVLYMRKRWNADDEFRQSINRSNSKGDESQLELLA